jgi:hypothetical protein
MTEVEPERGLGGHDVQLARVILFSGATLRALAGNERSARIEGEWCGREDLNLHTLSGTCTSSMRVYQFRHGRGHYGSDHSRNLSGASL